VLRGAEFFRAIACRCIVHQANKKSPGVEPGLLLA